MPSFTWLRLAIKLLGPHLSDTRVGSHSDCARLTPSRYRFAKHHLPFGRRRCAARHGRRLRADEDLSLVPDRRNGRNVDVGQLGLALTGMPYRRRRAFAPFVIGDPANCGPCVPALGRPIACRGDPVCSSTRDKPQRSSVRACEGLEFARAHTCRKGEATTARVSNHHRGSGCLTQGRLVPLQEAPPVSMINKVIDGWARSYARRVFLGSFIGEQKPGTSIVHSAGSRRKAATAGLS